MKVITYYVPVPGLWSDQSQRELIKIWERSWRKAGWEPLVIDESHIRDHPRFEFFKEHYYAKPTAYPVDYTAACFLRWFGAYVIGERVNEPVLLSDYDVINYGFAPRPPEPGKMEILCDTPPESIYMGAVLGIPQHFLDIAELFASWKYDELDFAHNSNVYHQDDLSMLARMFHPVAGDAARPKPEWMVKTNGVCALYDYAGYRTSPLVHYGFAMHSRGYWPKYKFIEAIRPF